MRRQHLCIFHPPHSKLCAVGSVHLWPPRGCGCPTVVSVDTRADILCQLDTAASLSLHRYESTCRHEEALQLLMCAHDVCVHIQEA